MQFFMRNFIDQTSALICLQPISSPYALRLFSSVIIMCKLCLPEFHLVHQLQDAVTSAGPLIALLGFLILPFVWSVPEALVTAELATAFPEDSGCALQFTPILPRSRT